MNEDGRLSYEEMIVIVIGSTSRVHDHDECVRELFAHINRYQIECLLCIEADSCLNAIDCSDPYYELQVLVSTYRIDEGNKVPAGR